MFLEHLCVRRGLGWNLNKPKTLLFRLWRNRGVLQFVATNALFAISIKNSGYTWLYRLFKKRSQHNDLGRKSRYNIFAVSGIENPLLCRSRYNQVNFTAAHKDASAHHRQVHLNH